MTTLLRWNPRYSNRRDVAGLRGELDQLFGPFVSGTTSPVSSMRFTLAADIHENPEAFVIRLDLPGVPRNDVKVTIMGDTLTIRGERKLEENRDQASAPYRERKHGTFERSFTLAAPVRGDQVQATYHDGVIEVRVPKAEEARSREIEIKVS